jgi:hypothetical protein
VLGFFLLSPSSSPFILNMFTFSFTLPFCVDWLIMAPTLLTMEPFCGKNYGKTFFPHCVCVGNIFRVSELEMQEKPPTIEFTAILRFFPLSHIFWPNSSEEKVLFHNT